MIVAILLFIVFLVLGVPVAHSMILGLFSYFIIYGQLQLLPMISQRMGNMLDSFTMLAVPLFLLAGNLIFQTGMADRLARFSLVVMGKSRGGLAKANVLANLIMAGISGSATADAAATGAVFIPLMKRDGYDGGFCAAVTAGASMLGPIIPPSIVMVIYAGLANESVGRMLLGGVIPGIFIALVLLVLVHVIAIARKYPAGQRESFREFWKAGFDALLAIAMPILMLGGLFTGLYTATEGAVIGVLYAFVVGVFVYRSLNWERLKKAFIDTFITNGIVMFMVAAASPVDWIMTIKGANAWIIQMLGGVGTNIELLWLISVIIILMVGIVLEPLQTMILTIPIITPALVSQNADPIVVGLVICLTSMLAALTPPVGASMFVTCHIAECSMRQFTKNIWPFMIVMVFTIFCFIAFPSLVTFLPNLLMGK